MPNKDYTAAILIIGDEILSGRTQDKNTNWLACQLVDLGIRLREVRVIADREADIVNAINQLRNCHSYVFTTGGIGPTHDDITSSCIAKAFSVPLIRDTDAVNAMESYYAGSKLTGSRLKMADIPQGAQLIDNPVSGAPGFIIGNVHVLAGVPAIMQAMFDNVKGELKGGEKMLSGAVRVLLPEGEIAEALGDIQQRHRQVEIGSYPFVRNNILGTSVVVRSTGQHLIDQTLAEITEVIEQIGGTYEYEN